MMAHMKVTEGLSAWYQDWNRAKYLSRFECWLNRSLWVLLAIALVYAVFQHVILANVPEIIRGGARLGEVCYDLAIAYAGAFVFYLLIVRLPLRRDRRNIYRHVGLLLSRVIYQAQILMQTLNRAADFDADRPNTLANVRQVCAAITPQTHAPIFMLGSANPLGANVMDAIYSCVTKARELNREILSLSAYLSTDLIDLIALIEDHGELDKFELIWRERHRLPQGDNLSGIAPVLFNYLLIVDRVAKYRKAFGLATFKGPQYLLRSGDDESDAIPLKGEVIAAPIPPPPRQPAPEAEG
jgi:hypothetical protein